MSRNFIQFPLHQMKLRLRNGCRVPEWAKNEYPSKLKTLGLECFKMSVKTKSMLRMKPGFLVKDILDRFVAKRDSKLKPDRSLFIYSVHDTTIIGILSALGVYEVILFLILLSIYIFVKYFIIFSFSIGFISRPIFQNTRLVYSSSFIKPMESITLNYFIDVIAKKSIYKH